MRLLAFLMLALLASSSVSTARPRQKNQTCDSRPKIASQPRSPESAKLKLFKAVGVVALIIDEDGNVADAKVQNVHPEAAREPLLAVAKTIKLKPRPGCGTLKLAIVFTGDKLARTY
jgi:hypothetical protein